MTYEEFKEKFPVGTIFKRFYLEFHCSDTARILQYLDFDKSIEIKWCYCNGATAEYTNSFGYIKHQYDFGFLQSVEPEPIVSSNCPRCSNEMVKKQSDQYGLIDKCSNCGYC